jgi:heme exporter protein A
MQLAAFDLACIRGGRVVFKNLRFAVHAGELVAITGPNGAGKSSLLRLIAGLLRPARGQLTLDGGGAELSIGEQAHYLGHQDALKPSLSVGENLAFWNDVLGGAREVATALAGVGLAALAHLPALYLSAGQAMLTRMMRTQLAGGGIILAAIHGRLDLEASQELRLGGGQ